MKSNLIPARELTCITVVENYNILARYAIESIKKFTIPCPKILVCLNIGNNKAVRLEKYKHTDISTIYEKDSNVKVIRNNLPQILKIQV